MDNSAQRIGKYELIEKCGSGGMARVWKAWDPDLKQIVAIKEPLIDARLPEAEQEELRRRFVDEARIASKLRSHGVVAIYYADVYEGRPYMVMEYIEDETLADRIERGPIPQNDVLAIMDNLLDALEIAHKEGVIHRDIKPSNIFVSPNNETKLVDFGIARDHGLDKSHYTQAGTTLGTYGYMSPEQVRGDEHIDGRSDLFSLGIVAYEMLTGTNPFAHEGDTIGAIAARIMTQDVADIVGQKPLWGVPVGMRNAILAALRREPDERPRTAREFKEMLHQPSSDGVSPDPYRQTVSILPSGVALRDSDPIPVPESEMGAILSSKDQGYTQHVNAYGDHSPERQVGGAAYGVDGSRSRVPWMPILAALVALAAGIVTAVLLSGRVSVGTQTDSAEEQRSSTVQDATDEASSEEETAVETEEKAASGYYLAVKNGKVAVFRDDVATPEQVSDIEVALLNDSTALALDKHVQADTEEDVEAFLDAYRAEAEENQRRAEEEAERSKAVEVTPETNEQQSAPQPTSQYPPVFTSASASCDLFSDSKRYTYYPGNVLDGEPNTAWCESVDGNGEGQWIELSATGLQYVSGINVVNGWPSTHERYTKNARVAQIVVSFSDGSTEVINLADDEGEWQTIYFAQPHETTTLRLTISSVYPGTKCTDTLLAEVQAF